VSLKQSFHRRDAEVAEKILFLKKLGELGVSAAIL
jgi:hypothetical protein